MEQSIGSQQVHSRCEPAEKLQRFAQDTLFLPVVALIVIDILIGRYFRDYHRGYDQTTSVY